MSSEGSSERAQCTSIDVSIVLTLHREAIFLARTLRSLAEASSYARNSGITVELVAVLDRADAQTKSALTTSDKLRAFDQIRTIQVDNGSLGPSRNDGCQLASGNYISFADADDLISFNAIERMFAVAARLGKHTILVPKFLFAFDASYHIGEYFDLETVTPLTLVHYHPFVSRIFAHRSLFDNVQFADVRITNGYAYEDWHFNCNAIAAGYTFRACEDTILFYRQRRASLLNTANVVSTKQIPPSALFEPKTYARICTPYADPATWPNPALAKPRSKSITTNLVIQELVSAANAIDPAVDLMQLRASHHFTNIGPCQTGKAYLRLCEIIGDRRFDEVFVMPFLTTGGADKYLLDIMRELVAIRQDTRILVLFGQPFEGYAWLDKMPAGTVHFDLWRMFPDITDDDRDVIALKLIQACATQARLHLKASPFAQRFFAKFAAVLKENRPVFYRFSDPHERHGQISVTGAQPFQFISDNIEYLDKLVCDNASIVRSDLGRISSARRKWHCLYARAALDEWLADDYRPPGKSLLWASRLDGEKRPMLLVAIAKVLLAKMPSYKIHVHGQPTLHPFNLDLLRRLPNVEYHGAFRSFQETAPRDHLCLIYTSEFDGIPNILIEAAAAGLPIIAPDVGGISELVQDGQTGILLSCAGDDFEDAAAYVAGIEHLAASPELCDKIRRGASELVANRHSPSRYAVRVREIFEPELLQNAPVPSRVPTDELDRALAGELTTLINMAASEHTDKDEEIRRLERVLAQERHATLFARQRIADLERAESPKIDYDTMNSIAKEVWREKRRRRLQFQVVRWVKRRLFSR